MENIIGLIIVAAIVAAGGYVFYTKKLKKGGDRSTGVESAGPTPYAPPREAGLVAGAQDPKPMTEREIQLRDVATHLRLQMRRAPTLDEMVRATGYLIYKPEEIAFVKTLGVFVPDAAPAPVGDAESEPKGWVLIANRRPVVNRMDPDQWYPYTGHAPAGMKSEIAWSPRGGSGLLDYVLTVDGRHVETQNDMIYGGQGGKVDCPPGSFIFAMRLRQGPGDSPGMQLNVTGG